MILCRKEIWRAGLKGFNNIMDSNRSGEKPEGWKGKEKKIKKKLLGTFKSVIFCPPIPSSELRSFHQRKEEAMRAGGREDWPIKIVKTAWKTLESTLVQVDPFKGNTCDDIKHIPARKKKKK